MARRPDSCPHCGASTSAHTGSYCQVCGEPLMPPASEFRGPNGQRVCAHCDKPTGGTRHGWVRCPSCDRPIHTTCLGAHGKREHPTHSWVRVRYA